MSTRLRERWRSRPARERQAWIAGALAVAGLACLAFVSAALAARGPLLQEVQDLRAVSARMDQQASEFARLQRLPAPSPPGGDLSARVQAATNARLATTLPVRLEAPDPRHVVVEFEAVAFAAWLGWLEDLASRQVRLESCRIEALPAAGQVRVTATLVQSGPP